MMRNRVFRDLPLELNEIPYVAERKIIKKFNNKDKGIFTALSLSNISTT